MDSLLTELVTECGWNIDPDTKKVYRRMGETIFFIKPMEASDHVQTITGGTLRHELEYLTWDRKGEEVWDSEAVGGTTNDIFRLTTYRLFGH